MGKLSTALKIAVFSLLAATLVHLYLTYHHYSFWLFGAINALCVAGQYFDCNTVDASPYSSFLGWFPLALLGAFVNSLLALWIFIGAMSDEKTRSRWLTAALVGSTFVVFMSFVMGTITVTQLTKGCIYCLATYLLSLLTWGALWSARPKNWQGEFQSLLTGIFRGGPEGSLSLLIMAVAILPVSWVIDDMVKSYFAKGLSQVVERSLQDWEQSPSINFSMDQAVTLGADAANAKLTLVEFADFQCPHCAHAAPVLHSFVTARPDVRLVFQSFPLDGTCNPSIPSARDGLSCDLAKSVWCGHAQNKGIATHDYIFEHFGQVTSAKIPELVQTLGLNATEFDSCLKSSETHEKILEQARRGKAAGVEGTPSIFANGKLLPAGYALPVLEALYRKLKSR